MRSRSRSPLSGWAAKLSLALVAAFVVACGGAPPAVNEPQPPTVAGFAALTIARAAPPQFSSLSSEPTVVASVATWTGPLVDAGIRLESTGNTGLVSVGGNVYVHAEFVLHNDTDVPLQNPVLLAYHREEFRVGSAISQPYVAAGGVASDRLVQSIKPTHRLDLDPTRIGSPDALVGRTLMSDFVALREAEVPSLAADFVTTVFPYGFAIGNGATIAPGDSATVHVAFTYPASPSPSSNLGRFTWNAVLMSGTGVRVTQAPAENHARGWAAVLDRADRFGADSIVAIGPGTRTVTDPALCEALVGLTNVRTAGVDTTDDAYVGLVPTPGAPQFAGCEGATP
jgi:hypothetical protein